METTPFRQYQFLDGVWIDTWTGEPAETSGYGTLSELVTGACVCVSDEVADLIAAYLGSADDDELIILDGSAERLLVAVLADSMGFVEHGGNINCSWLTDAGRAWLDLHRSEAAARPTQANPYVRKDLFGSPSYGIDRDEEYE